MVSSPDALEYLEPARSGRAKCTSCGAKIGEGQVRFGVKEPDPRSRSGRHFVRWFHPECAAKIHGFRLRQAMVRYAGELPGREELERRVANAAAPDERPSSEVWWKGVRSADLELVRSLVGDGSDVNTTDLKHRATALHHAVLMGNPGLMKVLIDCGADVDAQDIEGCRPLHYAASTRLVDAIELLLAAGAHVNVRAGIEEDRNTTPLHMAINGSWLSGRSVAQGPLAPAATVVSTLLLAGAKATARTGFDSSPLELAMGTESFDALLATVSEPSRLRNSKGWTLLHVAAWRGKLSTVRSLLAAGCDPNVETTREFVWGEPQKRRLVTVRSGTRPIDLAEAQTESEIVHALRRAGGLAGQSLKLEIS